MKIDIIPKIELASGLNQYLIDEMGQPPKYVIRTADGKDHSVHWDKKALDEFLPSRKVSEVMRDWEQGLRERKAMCEKVIKTKEHPTWTQPAYDENGETVGYIPYRLSDTKTYERMLKEVNKQIGSMEFVMIVGQEEYKKYQKRLVIQ